MKDKRPFTASAECLTRCGYVATATDRREWKAVALVRDLMQQHIDETGHCDCGKEHTA